MDALERRLDDGVLQVHERSWLDRTANDLGLDSSDRIQIRRQHFDLLIQQMLADGIDTDSEQQLAQQVAEALALGPADIPVTEQTAQRVEFGAGTRVCSTREAIVDGSVADRALLEQIATRAGMAPWKSATKKCDVLVAADPLSQSGKARQARDRSILQAPPVVAVAAKTQAARLSKGSNRQTKPTPTGPTRTVVSAGGGTLTGSWPNSARRALGRQLIELPPDVEVVPVRHIAFRLAELADSCQLSTLGGEAVASAEQRSSPLCVWSGDDGPRIRSAMSHLGGDYRTVQR